MSLKALAGAVLGVPHERDKVGQSVGQTKNLVPHGQESVGQKNQPSGQRDKPVKEEVKKPASEYTQTLLVKCPLSGGDLHCWYCSRCHKMESCPAIPGHLQQKVKGYTERRKPQSLHWVEGRLPHENNTLPAWEDICPNYWEGCFGCQSYKPDSVSYGFCSKYNREGKLLS